MSDMSLRQMLNITSLIVVIFNIDFQTMGRLKSRIAEQLLNELDPPDHQETIMAIKELQEMKDKGMMEKAY